MIDVIGSVAIVGAGRGGALLFGIVATGGIAAAVAGGIAATAGTTGAVVFRFAIGWGKDRYGGSWAALRGKRPRGLRLRLRCVVGDSAAGLVESCGGRRGGRVDGDSWGDGLRDDRIVGVLVAGVGSGGILCGWCWGYGWDVVEDLWGRGSGCRLGGWLGSGCCLWDVGGRWWSLDVLVGSGVGLRILWILWGGEQWIGSLLVYDGDGRLLLNWDRLVGGSRDEIVSCGCVGVVVSCSGVLVLNRGLTRGLRFAGGRWL